MNRKPQLLFLVMLSILAGNTKNTVGKAKSNQQQVLLKDLLRTYYKSFLTQVVE